MPLIQRRMYRKQAVVGVLATEVVGHRDPLEPLGLEELAKNVLEHVHLDAKALQMLRRCLFAAVRASSFK